MTRNTGGRPLANLPDEERCTATAKNTRKRCKKLRMVGLNVCDLHGGGTPASRNVNLREKFMRAYGNNHVDEDHVAANPVTGLPWELRRTAGNILAIEEELTFLDQREIVEGETVTTKRNLAAELYEVVGTQRSNDDDVVLARPGEEYTTTVRQQRLHMWTELYLRERKQYTELVRLMFAVGFEKKRIELVDQQVSDLNAVVAGVLRALGHDPQDPAVRAVVRQQIQAVAGAGRS